MENSIGNRMIPPFLILLSWFVSIYFNLWIPCDLLFQASALLSPSDAEEEHSSGSKSPRQTPVQIILICSLFVGNLGPIYTRRQRC